MHFEKFLGDFHIINPNMLRFCPCCLAPKVCKIKTKISVSVMDVSHSDRAVGNKFLMHHPSTLLISGVPHHPVESSSFAGLLNVMPCVTLKVATNCVHQHVLFVWVLQSVVYNLFEVYVFFFIIVFWANMSLVVPSICWMVSSMHTST